MKRDSPITHKYSIVHQPPTIGEMWLKRPWTQTISIPTIQALSVWEIAPFQRIQDWAQGSIANSSGPSILIFSPGPFIKRLAKFSEERKNCVQ